MAAVITVTQNAVPALNRLNAALANRRAIHQAMAEGARVEIQDHFARLTQTNRNHFGKRSTFWPRMRRGTFSRATDESGHVVMPQEVAQRYFGGTIRPTGGREALTIPVQPRAYGRRAGAFTDLTLIKTPGARSLALLVKKSPKREIGEVYYVLKKSVTQRGDQGVLPTEAALNQAATAAAAEYLKRKGVTT